MINTLWLRRLKRLILSGSTEAPNYRLYKEFLSSDFGFFEGGVFNLTVDFELGWSRARRGQGAISREESLERSRRARDASIILLDLCEQYSIPVTFAVVGHLAAAECIHSKPPSFRPFWLGEEWYAIDPDTNMKSHPDYYAPDLVGRIIKSPVRHELASHGFSHVDLSDETVTPEVAEFEINESRRVLLKFSQSLSTFIFPKNRLAFPQLIKAAGFTAYRSNQQKSLERDEEGLWRFPLGLWLSPKACGPKEVLELIDLAARRKNLIHVWCHLYEFESKSETGRFFRPIFDGLADRRQNGLAVKTLQEIVGHLEKTGH